MKLNAYILAADPAWIEASVLSYYDIVDRIVVSYDADGRGWTGVPIDVEQCLRRLRAIDRSGKLDFRPGKFAREAFFDRPMESETHQRQVALDQASDGADWVLQLDTDEVLGSTSVFRECLTAATARGRQALNYPSLWLYCQAHGTSYLEWCRRGWRRTPGYPGAMAVAARGTLTHARRVERGHFHVDLSAAGSPWRVPNGIPVDQVIGPRDAIWHFSMVRDTEWLKRKFSSWGHAKDQDWHPQVDRWVEGCRSPLRRVITSQFERGVDKRPLRFARIPEKVADLLSRSAVSDERARVEGAVVGAVHR